MLKAFQGFGLRTVPRVWECENLPAVMNALDELSAMRHDFAFDIDGGVIKVNERALYAAIGETAKSPRWAVAFKFEPDRAETRLRSVTVQVGRTGALTPVAELEPVLLAGSTIARATLHNQDDIRRKDIRIGDYIIIEKAGDVIPAVAASVPKHRTGDEQVFTMPDTCPACGGPVSTAPDEVAVRCEISMPGATQKWIAIRPRRHGHRRAWRCTIEQLVDQEWSTIPQIFMSFQESLASMSKGKNPRTIFNSIAKSRQRDMWRLILAPAYATLAPKQRLCWNVLCQP